MEFFQLTDQTISDITDELSFGVVKGASNNSFQQLLACEFYNMPYFFHFCNYRFFLCRN